MSDSIEKAVHGSESNQTPPRMHPEFFSFNKTNALLQNKGQKEYESHRIAEKHNGVVIDAMRRISNTNSHDRKQQSGKHEASHRKHEILF